MSPEPIFRPSNFKASVQNNIAGRERVQSLAEAVV